MIDIVGILIYAIRTNDGIVVDIKEFVCTGSRKESGSESEEYI
jgi:hypothetical protein